MKRLVMAALAAAPFVVASCQNAGSDRVLSVGVTGSMAGVVVFDLNGNGFREVTDTTLSGVTMRVVGAGSGAVVATQVTGVAGTYLFRDLPLGQYELRIDTLSVGDTVVVASMTRDTFTVTPNDTVVSAITVRYPFATTAEVRAAAVGRRLFLHGVALSGLGVFGDTTVHVADSSGNLRLTRIRPSAIAIGDSVRFLGRRNTRAGQPTLDDVTPFPISVGILPTAERINSATAATADAGRLDAALVSVLGVTVIDTATIQGGYRLTADDGSGVLTVILSSLAAINTVPLRPDSVLDLTGVLVPAGSGTWQLKPRLTADVIVN